jgi:hypothetical protein
MKLSPARAGLIEAAFAVAWCAAGCRSHPVPPAVDSAIASSIPTGVLVLGAIDLVHLRATPLYPKLPPAARALAENYRDAQRLLAAWNGTDILIVAQGLFREAPAGTTLATPDLALAGSPAMVGAAMAQHRTGKTGAPGLFEFAAQSASASQAWAAVRGGVALPLSGNAANLNRLLRNLDYAALAADFSSSVHLSVSALGRNEPAAREFEENLRALLSLASAAEHGHAEIAALLDSVEIRRDGARAHATLEAPPETIEKLFDSFTR